MLTPIIFVAIVQLPGHGCRIGPWDG